MGISKNFVDKPLPNSGPLVGVGVTRISETQNHAGLVFREDDADPKFLELRWHHSLHIGPPSQESAFALLNIHRLRVPAVAGYCQSVWDENREGRIPYGFKLPSECFDRNTAKWLLGDTGLGLTCATFVLAVLLATGINIADLDDWPVRDSDKEWQQLIICHLKNFAPKQAQYLESETGSLRYRPEEVGGAAASNNYPADFATAEKLGHQILIAMTKKRNEPA
jgi:hypothetical protein